MLPVAQWISYTYCLSELCMSQTFGSVWYQVQVPYLKCPVLLSSQSCGIMCMLCPSFQDVQNDPMHIRI